MYFVVGEKTLAKCSAMIFSSCAVLLCITNASSAQETKLPRPAPNVSHTHVPASASHPALDASATARKHPAIAQGQRTKELLQPADQPTQPATLTFRDGKLTVEANNSNLAQILQDLAKISGMTINGLNKGPRIFGVYGPGNLRDVLTDLLVGSGYNFIIVGGAIDSTPRELILTAQNDITPAFGSVNPSKVLSVDRDEAEQPESDANSPGTSALGPGAISPAPSLNDQDDNTRVQNTLERLEHQQQQLQNAPQ